MTRLNRDWTLALSLTLVAFGQRIWSLGYPKGYVFDEIYYAKNAYSLVQHGVELDKGGPEFVVHPPVGKWLIGIGIKIFGFNEFGWRIAAAVVGSLSVTLMYFTAKKLFNSEFISISAAFLILVDGLHLVHSRVALLDIFLMFFIQIAVLAILQNKYWLAGFALGLACATKWSGLYFLVALGLLVLIFDWLRHRYLGNENPLAEVLIFELPKRFLQFGLLPVATYFTSWIGWFISKDGWGRNSSTNVIKSLWNYHSSILDFHASLTTHHPYMSNPWSWIIMGRPTSFFYETPKGCGASNCSKEVLALGTPLLYWSIAIALLVVIGILIQKRDLTAGILLTVVGAGYLPWFFIQQRTMFTFYIISFEPFLILILVYVLNLFLKGARNEESLKYRKSIAIGIGAIYLLNFIYFLPLYYGTTITYNSWLDHMWLSSWI